MRMRLVLGVITVSVMGAAAADASSITNDFGLLTPDTTITFSEHVLAPEASVTNEYADLGVTFTPSLYYNTQPVFFPTASLANFAFSGPTSDPASIVFLQPVSAAAVAVQTNPGTTTFTALLNGMVVESFSAGTALSALPDLTNSSNYYGFSGILFDELRIDSGTTFFQIDNLEFNSAVPEPASLALFGLGLAGLGARRRRQRKQA